MRIAPLVRSALCWLVTAGALTAQQSANPRDALVVSPAWLAAHLADPNLVLLHVGPKDDYDKAHLPGARVVDIDVISVSDHSGRGLMLEMPPTDKLREGLASLGISNNSRIVVYFAGDFVTPATRVMLTLDYAGLGDRSSLLDGGITGWKRAGNPVTAAAPAVRPGDLAPLRIKPVVVDADYVRSHIGKQGVSIVDGRAAAFYDGVQVGMGHAGSHKTGHIAGARSVPFTEITDAQSVLKSPEQLAALFAKAGVAKGDTIIGYCHIGQQATGMLFAARTLGFPVVLYDGSFEDWSNRNLPVEATKP